MTGFRRLSALLLASLLTFVGLAGCATRPHSPVVDMPPDDPAAAFPAQVTVPGQPPVTIPQQPKRIISLSPTATETLYAVGAGSQVVAVDKFSNFPERAPRTALSGLNSDADAISGQHPDLVIAPDSATQLADGLRAIDVPVLLTPSPSSLDDAYQQIETIGQATGHTNQGREVTRRMREEISTIVAQTPKPPRPLTYFHEASPDGYTATSQSFVGSLYSQFGLVNVADQAGGKFPQLSGERVVEANPDLIFLADGEAPEKVGARPGWNVLNAVRSGHVMTLDSDVASRWGPRIVDLARTISQAVSRSATPPPN